MEVRVEALPHQRDLWAAEDDATRHAIVGPYGCGKTLALSYKCMLLARLNRGIDGLLVVPTYSMFRMVHLAEWPDLLAKVGVHLHWNAQDSAFQWPWGGKLWVRSAENPQRLAGPNLAYIAFDEPGQMREEAWERASVRARHPKAQHKQIVCTGTPEGLNWFADKFAHPEPPYYTHWAKCWHPDLAGYYDTIAETYGYDESLMASYAEGRFVPLRVGRCYHRYDPSVHISEEEAQYDPANIRLHLWCDFNVHYMRWVVVQLDGKSIRVIDEIALGSGSDTARACSEFLSRWHALHQHGYVIVTGDATGKAKNTAGRTDYQIISEDIRGLFRGESVRVMKANPLQKDRVDAVNYHLAGRGLRVYIHPKCKELTKDFERVVWREGSSSEIDKSDEKITHASDAFGYGIYRFARPKNIGVRTTGGVRDYTAPALGHY